MIDPGAESFSKPLPATQYATNKPKPGPGLLSSMKWIARPVSCAAAAPRGAKTPILSALLRNRTFAGSTIKSASGSNRLSISHSTPAPAALDTPVTKGAINSRPTSESSAPKMPSEKLLTSSSNPIGILG